MSKRGLFISFEGPDGGGKTTQIERVRVRLAEQGYDVIKTRELGGTPEAEKIRDLIVRQSGGDWLPLSTLLLIAAARYEHTEKLIKPALAMGKVVLTDRYADSTYVYQVLNGQARPHDYQQLYQQTLGIFKPDLTFILDLDPVAGLRRARASVQENVSRDEKSDDRFEQQGTKLQEVVRQGYLDIATSEPERCFIINAAQDVDKVTSDLWTIIQSRVMRDA